MQDQTRKPAEKKNSSGFRRFMFAKNEKKKGNEKNKTKQKQNKNQIPA